MVENLNCMGELYVFYRELNTNFFEDQGSIIFIV